MKKKHRNSQLRIHIEDGTYFITSNTLNWIPYFKEPIFCDLFVENLRLCKKLKGFLLYAWFLGYDHFHWLIRPGEECGISKVMQFLKRHISRDINYIIGYNKFNQSKTEGGIRESRLRGSKYECFQQIIDKHNQKIELLKFRFKTKYFNKNPFQKPCLLADRFQWHESFRDHYIRNNDDFDNHWEYIKRNPAKHDLPKNWPYIFLNDKYKDLIDDCF